MDDSDKLVPLAAIDEALKQRWGRDAIETIAQDLGVSREYLVRRSVSLRRKLRRAGQDLPKYRENTNERQSWPPDPEARALLSQLAETMDANEIAAHLGRGFWSVVSKASQLGVSLRIHRTVWNDAMREEVKKAVAPILAGGVSATALASALRRMADRGELETVTEDV